MNSFNPREILFMGGIGGITLFGALWLTLAPESMKTGLADQAMLIIAGNTYYGEVDCGDGSSEAPSLVKGFFGRHGGERVSVRAWSYEDASTQLQNQHPDCRTNVLERKKRTNIGVKLSF